jgi:hypothetical protein
MPFCPKCGIEYYEGFTLCSGCGTELVEHLPEGKPPDWTRQEHYRQTITENKLRGNAGGILKVVAIIMYLILGLAGSVLQLSIVYEVAGSWGVVVGIFLLPVVLLVAPWYALIAWGNWLPVVVVYGGGIAATILYAIGSAIAGD